MPTLFDPLTAGAFKMKNRFVMAPLTRSRAGLSRVPNALMAQYYAQRASAGLIVSEATAISPEGYGWSNAPGAYTDEHEKAWRLTTDAVHKAGGLIVLQLWHMGRLSHSDFHDGNPPVAPSAIAAPGQSRDSRGPKAYETPRALTLEEIKRTVNDYAVVAKRAMAAGFDGVEIHGANGYLIDQFLRDGTNTRSDDYGGSIENRARFLLEVTDAVTRAVGADRTGLRLSPVDNGTPNGPPESNLPGVFTHAAKELNRFKLAYLHVREIWRQDGVAKPLLVTPQMRKMYDGVMFANDSYDLSSANDVLAQGTVDAIAFGRPFIANPDLVERMRTGAPLNQPDPHTFYGGGAEGYIDYPFLNQEAA